MDRRASSSVIGLLICAGAASCEAVVGADFDVDRAAAAGAAVAQGDGRGGAGERSGAGFSAGAAGPQSAGGTGGQVRSGSGGSTAVASGGAAGWAPSTCSDDVQQPDEEGVDCGFVACGKPCLTGTPCAHGSDCASGSCRANLCAIPVGAPAAASLTLTRSAMPYLLTEDITVSEFSVEPGAVLLGDGHMVRVTETLSMVGTANERIVLHDVTVDPGTGDLNAIGQVDIAFVDVYGGTPRPASLESRLASYSITDCRFTGTAPLDFAGATGAIGGISILRNVFLHTGGVRVSAYKYLAGADVLIANNYLENVVLPGSPSIEVTFTMSGTAVTLELNTFKDLGLEVVGIGSNASAVTAYRNYWGTTDTAIVDQMIRDVNDSPTILGTVRYRPCLEAPDPGTPAL